MTRPLPKVAASSPSDPLRPAIEARSDAQPFQIDETRTRSVRPIPLAHIEELLRETDRWAMLDDGEPVPTVQAVAIFAGLVAGAAAGWALIYAAATLVATGQAMFL